MPNKLATPRLPAVVHSCQTFHLRPLNACQLFFVQTSTLLLGLVIEMGHKKYITRTVIMCPITLMAANVW